MNNVTECVGKFNEAIITYPLILWVAIDCTCFNYVRN